MRIDVAFRKLCDKLFLRAETQQIDRILETFSQRFWTCNPGSIYGSASNVHSLTFSILLLNTDLHIADISDRMTRTQFIRNTMTTFGGESGTEGTPSANDSASSLGMVESPGVEALAARSRTNLRSPATPMTPSTTSLSEGGNQSTNSVATSSNRKVAGPAVSPPLGSTARNRNFYHAANHAEPPRVGSRFWEIEIEGLLKEVYAAIKTDQIRLPVNDVAKSLAPSTVTRQGRRPVGASSDRVNALKRGSIRGLHGLQGLLGPNSAQTTEGSGSQFLGDSWLAAAGSSFVQTGGSSATQHAAALGFAGTLSHSIIKESQDEETAGFVEESDDLTDDELVLLGPPWAKEGVLTRKQYWEATQKRAKDKSWTEAFVVAQKGVLSMFRFGDTISSKSAAPATVGGGNWLTNATSLGTINLAHTLSNVLPPPGYNKARPHVFALTLPGGAVFFFQAGHEELVHEWVSTCNYWAARQSKEPLAGGVSNMEYGWSKVLPSGYDEEQEELDGQSGTSDADHGARSHQDAMSVRSGRSGRSSRSKHNGGGSIYGYKSWKDGSVRGNNGGSMFASSVSLRTSSILGSGSAGAHANERIYINEWKPPQLPTVPSTLKEEEQLERIVRHVATIELELTAHHELREPMLQLYSPRGANYAKALANWEKKSNHLLQELVKYQCYIESLKNAARLRAEKRGQKMLERDDE